MTQPQRLEVQKPGGAFASQVDFEPSDRTALQTTTRGRLGLEIGSDRPSVRCMKSEIIASSRPGEREWLEAGGGMRANT